MRWLKAIGVVFLLPLLFAGFTAHPASAEEYIRAYHSDIKVAADGGLTVAETITVNAEGADIRRGIFRDFPLTMRDATGNLVHVGFDIVSLTRDGRAEDYHTESISGGIRIYAGSKDVMLSRGEHTYVLTYATDRQIRYFDDHDELYWNVTGNFWQFRIASASADVTLPDGARINRTAAFTGSAGSTAVNATAHVAANHATFATTAPLGRHEGLTIVVGMPKGVIAPPSGAQQRAWWLRDHMATLIGIGGFVIVLAYYGFVWTRVGRDPPRGTIVPRWDAPDGLSPALVNYIDNRGFSGGGWTAFAATALNLAVKGQVVLKDLHEKIVIAPVDNPPKIKLEKGEFALLAGMGKSAPLLIDKANGTQVQKIGADFRKSIESEHAGRYYKANWGYIVLGLLITALVFIALIAFGDLEPDMIAMLVLPTFSAIFFGFFAVAFGKKLRRGASLASRIMAIVLLGFIGFVALIVIAGITVSMAEQLQGAPHVAVFAAAGGIVLANAIFFFLMGAPTPLGRRLKDGIEGLRTYLTVAEKDRMNMAGAPQMSPQHFETLLPYAVALGVEKPWSRAFEAWLATAVAAGAAAYAPGWYSGDSYHHFGDRIGGFSSSMASTIQSTLPAPTSSSSSGFSGGSSGGGGGGGGGGGW